MAKRYHGGIEKEHIVIGQLSDMYHCPDCGFEFNSQYVYDDEKGGYTCPVCEGDELRDELTKINKNLEDCDKDRSRWIGKYNEESLEKWKYKNAFEALYEKISKKK